jgi:hypothetical protein
MTGHTDYPDRLFSTLPMAELVSAPQGWEVRLLSSPILQRLGPREWQRLLRGMTVEAVEPGQTLIQAGTVGDVCYVLRRGRAAVHVGRQTLAILEPGSLFGEDALISGGTRNASVTFLGAGAVGRLDAWRFESWLLEAAIRPLDDPAGRLLLDLDPCEAAVDSRVHLPLQRLRDPALRLISRAAYCVIGATLRERCLAAFVLTQRGFDVAPLADG